MYIHNHVRALIQFLIFIVSLGAMDNETTSMQDTFRNLPIYKVTASVKANVIKQSIINFEFIVRNSDRSEIEINNPLELLQINLFDSNKMPVKLRPIIPSSAINMPSESKKPAFPYKVNGFTIKVTDDLSTTGIDSSKSTISIPSRGELLFHVEINGRYNAETNSDAPFAPGVYSATIILALLQSGSNGQSRILSAQIDSINITVNSK